MPSSFDNAKLAASLPWEHDWVTAVAFVGDSRQLVAGNRLGGILLWDLPATLDANSPPPPRRTFEGHTNAVSHIASTPYGKWVVSAGFDHTVVLWDVSAAAQGTTKITLDPETRRENLKRSKKEKEQPEATVEVVKPAKVLSGHGEWIQAMAMSRDGRLLVTGDDAGEIIVWRLPEGSIVRRWKTKGWISALAIAPDNKTLAVAERIPLDGDRFYGLGLWGVETGERRRNLMPTMPKKDIEFASADFAPDGRLLAVGQGDDETSDGKVFLIDPQADEKAKVREGQGKHQYGVRCLRFTRDGRHLLSGGRDTLVRVWNPADGAMLKEIGNPRGGQFKDWICALDHSAAQNLLAAADMAGRVQVWSLT